MSNREDRDPVEEGREKELVVRAQSGDRAAFAALVRAHQDEVFTLARRLVGDPHMAADIAQETLVRAWRALPSFRGDSKLSTWLHRITVNTAWTHRDRARRNAALALEDVREQPDNGPDDPEVSVVSICGRPTARPAAGGQRQVVVMKDVYGWSHQEIVTRWGLCHAAKPAAQGTARLARDLESA